MVTKCSFPHFSEFDVNSFGPTTELEPEEPETPDMEFEMELEEAISMMSSDDDVVPEQFSLLLSSLMSKATDEGKVMMVENLAKIFNDNQNQKENRKPKTNLLNVSYFKAHSILCILRPKLHSSPE